MFKNIIPSFDKYFITELEQRLCRTPKVLPIDKHMIFNKLKSNEKPHSFRGQLYSNYNCNII